VELHGIVIICLKPYRDYHLQIIMHRFIDLAVGGSYKVFLYN